jgi:hypothetical protein
MLKRITLLTAFILIFSCKLSKAQEGLKFKLYDKEVTFDESYLDRRFAPHLNANKVLSKNGELSYKEYAYFKSRIKQGNVSGQYLIVDNLRRFYLNPFENGYYLTLKSDAYKEQLRLEDDKQEYKRKMEIRNALLGWIIDLILEYR